jgi:phospholipid/cholesterol/gamma-HCH transport system substrate-binding protein
VKNLSSQAKVGLLVLGGLLILAYMTIRVEHLTVTKNEGYIIKVVFDTVAGLDEKAPVKVAGVEAGRVEEIRLIKGKAELHLWIQPDIKLHRDAKASVRSLGLLGDKYVELTSGSLDQPLLENGDTIKAQAEMTDLDQLAGRLSTIADDVKSVTASISRVLGGEKGRQTLQRIVNNVDSLTGNLNQVVAENRQNLSQVMDNLNRLSHNLNVLVDENKKLFNATMSNMAQLAESLNHIITDNRESLTNTIAQLEKFSQTLGEESPGLARNMNKLLKDLDEVLQDNRENLKISLERIRDASRKLDSTLSSLERVSQKVARGEGTIGKLIYEEEAYTNLTESLGGLKEYFQRAEAWKFFLGVRSEYLTEDEKAKTYVSLRLQPREDKYYLLEVVDDPRGKVTTETTKRTVDGQVTEIEEEITEDELKFSLELAKRFYDFTVRGGLIESSGGVGLDYELLDDRLKLSLEGWDLGEDEPHLKFTGSFYFYNRMFINAGVDDIVDDDYRSFFAGAGLMFSDQDLKYLLGSVTITP